jgi:hypothetical protein
MDSETEKMLDAFREITETEKVEHVWENGEYQGCIVTYKNPLHPDLQTVFYPYIPLLTYSGAGEFEPPPKLTRDYFISCGLDVPGEPKTQH